MSLSFLRKVAASRSRHRTSDGGGNVDYRLFGESQSGICNVCCNACKLTPDHVPPRGSLAVRNVEIRSVQSLLGQKNVESTKAKFSQCGLAYKTVCGGCNSDMGGKYDPEYIAFAQRVRQVLTVSQAVILPDPVAVQVKPVRLAKAILGHLLAAKTEGSVSDFDHAIGRSIKDEQSPVPDGLFIHYFIHAHHTITVWRDIAMPREPGRLGEPAFFYGILKSFPLGFVVSDAARYGDLPCLSSFCEVGLDDLRSVPIPLRLHPVGWPEHDRGNYILTGATMNDAAFVTPRGRILKADR
ncbi:MAG: hypothetical protein KGR26_05040 [Cyanobacteria bacterium REEB65]|nr:hypothetical protein [Cyanobacteria bacterium REEB65]